MNNNKIQWNQLSEINFNNLQKLVGKDFDLSELYNDETTINEWLELVKEEGDEFSEFAGIVTNFINEMDEKKNLIDLGTIKIPFNFCYDEKDVIMDKTQQLHEEICDWLSENIINFNIDVDEEFYSIVYAIGWNTYNRI